MSEDFSVLSSLTPSEAVGDGRAQLLVARKRQRVRRPQSDRAESRLQQRRLERRMQALISQLRASARPGSGLPPAPQPRR